MNSVSRVSAIAGQCQAGPQNPWPEKTNEFVAIHNALQSGNLWAAQRVMATLQQGPSQMAGGNGGSDADIQASGAFQALQSALSSGNVSAAQEALAALQLEYSA